jgi:tetratricopeptide (TPR) repeat protein
MVYQGGVRTEGTPMKTSPILLAVIFATGAGAVADVIHLKDGATIEGTVKKAPDGWMVTMPGGKVMQLPTDSVKSIDLTGSPAASPRAADDRLASLRRSVDYVPDIHQIIERYQRFIDQNAGMPAAAEARADLVQWQDRLARGLVKVGNKWITPEERSAMQERTIAAADDIRKLLRSGRLNEADAALNKALAADPQSPTLLFLRGLLLYRQEQIVPARKTFETANSLLPDHAPTLNNLAVVYFRQNQIAAALNLYDQAMLASPQNREILNNVAEALYAMPDEQRNTPVAQKAARHFAEQDLDLARKLEKEGLYRWGAQWVDARQIERLRAAEKEILDKLDGLSAEFDATKVRIANIDREIEDNDRAMRRLEATTYARDLNGNFVYVPLPSSYYELQRDGEKLKRERLEQYARLDALRDQAKSVRQQLPIPRYTGMQRVIDVEGAPVMFSVSTTQPTAGAATQP